MKISLVKSISMNLWYLSGSFVLYLVDQYVRSSYNYTLNLNNFFYSLYIGDFAFDLYDVDVDGYISTKEASQMCSELKGTRTPDMDITQE